MYLLEMCVSSINEKTARRNLIRRAVSHLTRLETTKVAG